jgi:adenine-specific DNA-methyltransferase
MSKDNYKDLSKEELIEKIEKLESRKKYGLIWDEEKTKEKFEKDAENALPVLKEVKGKEIKTDDESPANILIEGDNYHALSVLNFTHQNKIDVIYIDPPYNRGGDFKYNDKYVEKDDAYKHSKWLTFLSKRLRLAKKLLADNGVMFISIDDSEQAQLKLLLNEIFGEDNVDIMIWRKSGYGRDGKMKNTTTFRKDHEYILVCYKYEKKLNKINELPDFQGDYSNPDNDPRGPWLSGSISRADYASKSDHAFFYTVSSPSGKKISRQFEISKEDFDELNKNERISWGKKGDAVPRLKIFLSEERSITPYSILLTKGTTTEGTKEVSQILEKDCSKMRPKPIGLIKTLIQLADKGKDLTVLDFFAGTGTTGHALLNYALDTKEKEVKFILCTNDDEGICTEFCYPRTYRVMKTGYKNKDGQKIKPLGGNLKYFKTAFVKNSISRDEMKIKITEQCTEMLCLREGIFDEVKNLKSYKIFQQSNKIMAVYYSLEKDKLDSLKKSLDKIEGEKILYCFTLDYLGLDKSDFVGWDDVILEPIPQKILDVYKDIYEY